MNPVPPDIGRRSGNPGYVEGEIILAGSLSEVYPNNYYTQSPHKTSLVYIPMYILPFSFLVMPLNIEYHFVSIFPFLLSF